MFAHRGGQHGRRRLLWQFTVAIKSDPVVSHGSSALKHMPEIKITDDVLDGLREQVLHEEDRCLFDEVVKIVRVGANRSAYIMVWIACAESLKRRLKWAAEKDNQAGKLLGAIEEAERKHHAVDAALIDASQKTGVLSDVEKTHLLQIYENRNIFGHPYNVAPDNASLLAALNVTVGVVFSKPNKLKHSYAIERLQFLTQDKTYIEDNVEKIQGYARQVVDRLDSSVHRYFIMRYFKEIDKIWKDPEQAIFKRRGMWFSKAFLEHAGVDSIIGSEEWHDMIATMPEFISWLAVWQSIFPCLSDVSKDEAVLKNIELSDSNPRRLKRLYQLHEVGLLSDAHSARVREKCGSLSGRDLCESEIPLVFVIGDIIKRLNSSDFRTANAGADVLFWGKVDELQTLSERDQIKVGDRLADAALINAFDAVHAVKRIAVAEIDVPYPIKYGYCLHFFSRRLVDALTRDALCDNSLAILCMLKGEDAKKIDDQLREAANADMDFAVAMQSNEAKKFVQKYKDTKTPPF